MTGKLCTEMVVNFDRNLQSWCLSLFAWVLLAVLHFTTSHQIKNLSAIIYCTPEETFSITEHSTQEMQSVFSRMVVTIGNGLFPWLLMIIAMMFPLLNAPVRHVAFSVKRKNRFLAIIAFLIGYTIPWIVIGAVYLLLPLFFEMIIDDSNYFKKSIIKSAGFLLAAAWFWLPGRRIRMIKCSQTMPISIQGWQLYFDSLLYGLKMGLVCISMCWAYMFALVLAHHNIFLMYVVTIVLFFERYLMLHTSKLPGYIWLALALILFCF